MEKQIVIIKPKSLSPKDKGKLTKAGKIVIESESDIQFKEFAETLKYTFTTCYRCGDRIYVTEERLSALKNSKTPFYCSHGHQQSYK